MKHLKPFSHYLNESKEGFFDVMKIANNSDLIKKIFEFGSASDIDALILSFGDLTTMIDTFKDASESIADMKGTISLLFAKNPKPLKMSILDKICQHLKVKYHADDTTTKYFKDTIINFAKSFNIPIN